MNHSVSIVVPTYERDQSLIDTVATLLGTSTAEVVLVDQTSEHTAAAEMQLRDWHNTGVIRWLRLPQPSIPHAMNVGLQAARGDVILFLDDDIEPTADLAAEHLAAHERHPDAWAVVGQVLQPGEESAARNGWTATEGFRADLDFPFWSNEPAWVSNVMAGNLSVKRDRALAVGGFDENFEGVAYRFETDFARRVIAAGGRIRFEPRASLRHLRAMRGGTRSTGSHLTSASPKHGMGDYYFALRSELSWETASYMIKRPFREVATKFHLRHPWYIPVKLWGEARAFGRALAAAARGPRFIREASAPGEKEPSSVREPAILER